MWFSEFSLSQNYVNTKNYSMFNGIKWDEDNLKIKIECVTKFLKRKFNKTNKNEPIHHKYAVYSIIIDVVFHEIYSNLN